MSSETLNDVWFKLSLTIKIVLFIVAVSSGVAFLLVNAREALAANLKTTSIVTENTLTLGDIFDGLQQNADYVLGAAPQPGEDMVLNARTLYRIAIAMDLPWRPATSSDQVVVRRAATIVPYDAIEAGLRDELAQKGVSGRYNLSLSNGTPKIILPQDQPESLEVVDMNFDPKNDIFAATIVAPSKANPLQSISIAGRIERLTSIPVLRQSLRNGDIIGANDLNWIEVTAKKIQNDILLDEKDVIGMTPRRISFAGKPMLATELESPKIVERGDEITIIYTEGPITLTAKGKALQTGARGDIVRVANSDSNKSIEAFVTAEREVTVR